MTTPDDREPLVYDVARGTINDREARLRSVEHFEQAEQTATFEEGIHQSLLGIGYALLAIAQSTSEVVR